MRISAIFLFLCVFTTYAEKTYSQNARVNIQETQLTIGEFIDQIENQTDYLFVYSKNELDTNEKISVESGNRTVIQYLDEVFRNTNLKYVFENDYIVLTVNKASSLPDIQQIGKQITGTVTDENDDPIIGANVVEKGTTNGVITDMDGQFSLSVAENSTLQISYIGYVGQEIRIGNQTNLSITLKEDSQTLEEVVVIGYGTMKKSDLTGSVASVKGDNLTAKAATLNVSDALQGMTPGVMVTRDGASDLGASSTIRIRGVTTIGDSDPLIIIDGVPAASLDRISPNDIESISILKDAASAAIYGSRGAAGVILVTTKRAKDGQLSMSYDYSFSMEQPTRIASYGNAVEFMKMQNAKAWNDNRNVEGGEYTTFSKEMIDNYSSLHAQDPDNYPDTNWQDLMLETWAYKNRHAFSFSAGSKFLKSYVSLNVDDVEGLTANKEYSRFTIRANNDITINKYLSADLNLNGLYTKKTEPSALTGQNYGPAQILGPIYPAEWSDGRIAPGMGGRNPYALLKHAGNLISNSSLFGGKIQLNFTPIEGLKLSAAYSAELYNIKMKDFRKQLPYTSFEDPLNTMGFIQAALTNQLSENRNDRLSTNLQFLATFSKRFDKHDIQLMGGYEENTDSNEYLGASRNHYTLQSFPYLSIGNANYQFNSGSATEYANRSVFGRIVYNYGNKYLLQSNLRYDGSSRFHKDHRWGFFPSVSAGWVVSEEAFMKGVNDISNMKIRASWGRLGNERIGFYPYQSTIAFNSFVLFQGNDVVAAQGAGVKDYAIPDISWETTESYDIGVDLGFMNNRLTVTADYYKKTTKDMLLALEIPNFIGLTNPQQNTGKMNTKGWELFVGWNDKIEDVSYSVSAHLSDSKSIMGDLGGTEFLGAQVKMGGSEFNEWYGYKSDGLYQTQEEVDNSATLYANLRPGDVKYKDISGPDGVPDGKISAEYDRVLLGGSLPRFLYGGNINVGYKGFTFGLIFQGIGKQNAYMKEDWVSPIYEVSSFLIGNTWDYHNTDEQNSKMKYPRFTAVNRTNNYAVTDYWLFNGAYFRLKNISLTYDLPQNLISKVKLNAVRLKASASDVFSIDDYPEGWDPETNSTYWLNKAFTFGILVNF